MGDFEACRFDFRIDTKNGLTPSRRRQSDRRSFKYNYNTFFKCKECGKLFETRPRLLVHKLVHKDYRCTCCAQSFSRRAALREHINDNHKGANVQCELVYTCNKLATTAGNEDTLREPTSPSPSQSPVQLPSDATQSQIGSVVKADAPYIVAPGMIPVTTAEACGMPSGYMCINMPLMLCSQDNSQTVYSSPIATSPCVVSDSTPMTQPMSGDIVRSQSVASACPYYIQPAENNALNSSPTQCNAISKAVASLQNREILQNNSTKSTTAALHNMGVSRCSCDDDDLEPGEIRRPKPCCHSSHYLTGPAQEHLITQHTTSTQLAASPKIGHVPAISVKTEPTEESTLVRLDRQSIEINSAVEHATRNPQDIKQERADRSPPARLVISRLPNGEHRVTEKPTLVSAAIDDYGPTVNTQRTAWPEQPIYRCELCGFPGCSALQLAEHACPNTGRGTVDPDMRDIQLASQIAPETPDTCDLCGFTAKNPTALEEHACSALQHQSRPSLDKMVNKLWQTKIQQPTPYQAKEQLTTCKSPTIPPDANLFNAEIPSPPSTAPTRKRHNDYCTIKFHTCKFCRQLFDSAEKMWEHAVTHEDFHRRSRYYAARRLSQANRAAKRKAAASSASTSCQQDQHERLDCVYGGCSTSVVGYHALLMHVEQEHLKKAAPVSQVPSTANRMLFTMTGAEENNTHSGWLGCDFPRCRKKFSDWRQLKHHLSMHASEKPLACALCPYTCRHRSSMNWHMKSKHGLEKTKSHGNRTIYVDRSGNVVDSGNNRERISQQRVSTETSQVISQSATASAPCSNPQLDALQENTSANNEKTVHIKDESDKTSNLTTTKEDVMAVHNAHILSQDRTDEPIDMSMKTLCSHSLKHATCNLCGQLFQSNDQLLQHHAEHHEMGSQRGTDTQNTDISLQKTTPLFHCAGCDHVAVTFEALQCHLLATHGGEAAELRRYVCGTCRCGFGSRSALAQHALQHDAQTKHACAQCGLHVTSRPALARHVRRVHARFTCSHGGCRRRFDCAALLRAHQATHVAARPLVCRYPGCTRSFREAKHLRVHAMQHTDERPLRCELCEYACRQRNSMNWHMKSKHQLYKHVTVDGKTVYS